MVKKVDVTGTKVLLRMVPKEETVKGIYVPESSKSNYQKGTVIAYGEKCSSHYLVPDTRVLIGPDAGIEVDLEKEAGLDAGTYKVVEDKDILVIIF